jgi:tetratricopeptide (TPR) repeat protein
VDLLVARARAVRPDLRLGPEDRPTLAEIARRLDGLPLAIELAAARLAVMEPPQLLRRLHARLDLLTHAPRGAAPRHATLRRAIEWSWRLLSETERVVLEQCTAFRGGFDLEGAEAVIDLGSAAATGVSPVLDTLQALRHKSLLAVLPTAPPAGREATLRLTLLESIAEYGRERLAERGPGVAAELYVRHAHHYAGRGAADADAVEGSEGAAAAERLRAERHNLRALVERAPAWLAPSRRAADRGVLLQAALALTCDLRLDGPGDAVDELFARLRPWFEEDDGGTTPAAEAAALRCAVATVVLADVRFEDGLALLETAGRAAADLPAALAAQVFMLRGYALAHQDRHGEARAAIDAALERAHTAGAKAVEVRAMAYDATVRLQAGDVRGALEAARRAAAGLGLLGRPRARAAALLNVANYLQQVGGVAEAATAAAEAAAVAAPFGGRLAAYAAHVRGVVAIEAGRAGEAVALFRDCLAKWAALGLPEKEPEARRLLASALLLAADPAGAICEAEAALAGARTLRVARLETLCWTTLALAYGEAGRPEDAAAAAEGGCGAADGVDPRTAGPLWALRGALAAGAGQHATARTCRAAAEGCAQKAGDETTRWVLRLYAAVGASEPPGPRRRGSRSAAPARARAVANGAVRRLLVDALGQTAGPAFEVRMAARALLRLLEPPARRAVLAEAHDPAGRALLVDARGGWFRPPRDRWRGLERRPQLRRVLVCLAAARLETPGVALAQDAILERAWPGERVLPLAARARVHKMLSLLRRAGLGGLMLTVERGWLLDPAVPLIHLDTL